MASDIITLLNGRGTASLLHDLSARLGILAGMTETQSLRAEVDAILDCKWWDLRVKAIQVLGRWGGKTNKIWLLERACRPLPFRHGDFPFFSKPWFYNDDDCRGQWEYWETDAARKTLQFALKEEDASWLLRSYFRRIKFDGLTADIVMHMPTTVKRAWTVRALTSQDISTKKDALCFVYSIHTIADREQILLEHCRDPDIDIATLAKMLCSWNEIHKANSQNS